MKLCSDCWLAPPVAAADEYDSDYRDDPQRHECLLSEQCVMYCTGCKQSLCRMCAYKDTCQGYCHTPLCSQCRRQCLLCNETFCRQCSQQCRFCSSVFCHTCFDDNVCSTKCTALYKIEKRRQIRSSRNALRDRPRCYGNTPTSQWSYHHNHQRGSMKPLWYATHWSCPSPPMLHIDPVPVLQCYTLVKVDKKPLSTNWEERLIVPEETSV